jgi:outer membrane protein W
MFRGVLCGVLLVLVTTSAAWAQAPKVELTGIFGWTLADGVSGDPVAASNGKIYNRIDPNDSASFGFSFGFYLRPSMEVGFLWRRQPTSLEASGSTVTKLSDINIDGYHAYGTYYIGDSESKIRPYVQGGIGLTHFGGIKFTGASGQAKSVDGNSQFSTTWGAGVKMYASPNVGVRLGVQWTPTYIKSDATGWWCDPYWGCYVTSNAQYSNQFEFTGGLSFRF